jgi:hypothetical protein
VREIRNGLAEALERAPVQRRAHQVDRRREHDVVPFARTSSENAITTRKAVRRTTARDRIRAMSTRAAVSDFARSGVWQQLSRQHPNLDIWSIAGVLWWADEYAMPFRRAPKTSLADDPVIVELTSRLTSLHDHCLTNLVEGLDAMRAGDLTVAIEPKPRRSRPPARTRRCRTSSTSST